MDNAAAILDFWIGPASHDPLESQKRSKLWFNSTPAKDRKLKKQFGDLLKRAEHDELDHWSDTVCGSLALVILLDQFSRNLYRGTAAAFQNDAKALRIAKNTVDRGQDLELSLLQRAFLYHPFEHSESLQSQHASVRLFSTLEQSAPEAWFKQLSSFADHARAHCKIIEEFGRYPHRNDALGRQSTEAERHYLERGGKRFGQ